MTWIEAVKQAVSQLAARRKSNLFTRQLILEEELENIIRLAGSQGRTPEQTLSRVLQELRNDGSIEFLGSGEYQLLNSTLDPISTEEDIAPSVERVSATVSRPVRDSGLVKHVKIKYGFKCQLCGIRLELQSGFYCEAHHVRPLGAPHDGPDILSNLIVVCPNHHALLDFAAIRLDVDSFLERRHSINSDFINYHNLVLFERN